MVLSKLCLILIGFLALPVSAQVEVPKNDGWVTDLGALLSDQEEQQLEALMESYKQGSSHEIALLTVPDLDGQPIERYALEVGRSWGIGEEGKNNGALLVISKGDRKMRIEVGRGLEGGLTDAISGRIIRDVMTPAFRNGDFPGGILAGVQAMHAAIGGDYAPLEESRGGRSYRRRHGGRLVGLIALLLLIALSRGRGGRGGGMSILPWLLLSGVSGGRSRSFHAGTGGGGGLGGGFSGFGGGGGFSGGGASGGW